MKRLRFVNIAYLFSYIYSLWAYEFISLIGISRSK